MKIERVRIGRLTLKITTSSPEISITIPINQLIPAEQKWVDLTQYNISDNGRIISWPTYPDIEPINLDLLTGNTDNQTLLTPITYIAIKAVRGLHPYHQALDKAGHLPTPLKPPDFDKEAMLAWLEINPVIIQQQASKVLCVANTRAYIAAINLLPPDTNIPVRWYTGRNDKHLKILVAADRLMNPLIHYETGKLIQRQFQLLEHLERSKYPKVISTNPPITPITFAKQIGVDPRTLRPKEKQGPQSGSPDE
ncbi:hypothetical protein [Marinospirillum sp.]|uniref:hypothetical protein n=1 Tax=Marinospirillum sp. TaxID=2183934 RepID=UPI00384A998B